MNYLLKEERRETRKILERELKVDHIRGKVVAIIGPRRAGKTYFLYKLRENFGNFLHVDFENVAFKGMKEGEFFEIISLCHEIFGRGPETLFLDEVQELKNWQSLVRSLIEEYNVFISGSSSKLLSREIATQLRGRTVSYLLLPFSFREFLKARNFEIKKYYTIEEEGGRKKELRKYLEYGAFPEVVMKKEKERILKEYFNTILYNDYVERFGLENIELAKTIFEFCFQNFAKEMSVRKILNYLSSTGVRAGKNTLYTYIHNLPETLTVFFVEKFSQSVYERVSWPRKVYICDLGLSKILGFTQDLGKSMENVVFLELLRGMNIEPLRSIYFYKTKDGREVDFVIKEKAKIKQLIQVTYASGRDEIEKREVRSLLKAGEELRCKDLLVITWDYEGEEKIGNQKITFVPLWKWLLGISV